MPQLLPHPRTLLPYGLAVLSGVLLQRAFAPDGIEILAWVGLLPILSVLWPLREDAPAPTSPFLLGYVFGLAFFLPDLAWLRHSARVIHGALDHQWIGLGPESLGALAVVGLSAFLALYFALWSWFCARIAAPRPFQLSRSGAWNSNRESVRSAVLAAAAWVGCEWLRGWIFTGFGWNGLGVALHRNTTLVQMADTVGVTGLSFLPVLIACVGWINVIRLARHWRGSSTVRTRLDFTFAMVLLLLVAGYGMFRIHRHDTSPSAAVSVRTLLVQPNVPQVTRWKADNILEFYQRLSDRTRLYAEARGGQPSAFDLVVWPENAMPVTLELDQGWETFHREFIDALLSTGNFAVLTGVGTRAEKEPDQYHNSALLFQGSYTSHQRAHKQHLVPFGEYLPFRDQIAFMETLFGDILPGDFRPGKGFETLPLQLKATDSGPEQTVGLIPLICFEDTVGRLARKFVRPAPQILANMTNDGWFLQSRETEVHLANALFRAIELRRPMLRAANTGVTCFIDPLGRIVSRLNDPVTRTSFIEGCLPGTISVPLEGEMTFYARHGDVFAWSCLGLAFLSTCRMARRAKPGAQPPAAS